MSQAEYVSTEVAQPTIDQTPDLDTIGIEFEYPIGDGTPSKSERSRNLRQKVGSGNSWHLGEFISDSVPAGQMTSDHVGAEITSAKLDLHSTDPEYWYAGTIDKAEEMGYPFSRSGYGETVFGMHIHMSELSRNRAEALYEMCQEPWMRVFVCTSLSEKSADPWRHGGVNSRSLQGGRSFEERQRVVNSRRGNQHYEWRLPEPMGIDNFMLVMRFLRKLSVEGPDDARDFAKTLVENKDDRITSIQQYHMLEESGVDFTSEEMVSEDNGRTLRETAEYMVDLMQ